MQAYRTRRGGQHAANERGRTPPFSDPTAPRPKIVIIGLYRSFELWMRENPVLAGPRMRLGCAYAVLLSHPEHIERARGLNVGSIITLDRLPEMKPVFDELVAMQRSNAAA